MQAVLIQAICRFCGTSNRMVLHNRNSSVPKCGKCHREVFEKFLVVLGYVYILSNPGMPKLLKVGQTSGSIQRRIDQLSAATGVPTSFIIEAYFVSQNPKVDEKKLHEAMAQFRRPGREFFELSLGKALAKCTEVLEREPNYVRSKHGPFREP